MTYLSQQGPVRAKGWDWESDPTNSGGYEITVAVQGIFTEIVFSSCHGN